MKKGCLLVFLLVIIVGVIAGMSGRDKSSPRTPAPRKRTITVTQYMDKSGKYHNQVVAKPTDWTLDGVLLVYRKPILFIQTGRPMPPVKHGVYWTFDITGEKGNVIAANTKWAQASSTILGFRPFDENENEDPELADKLIHKIAESGEDVAVFGYPASDKFRALPIDVYGLKEALEEAGF